MSEKLQKFMQLTKVDVAKRHIYGTFTAEVPDKSGEVADYDTTKAAILAWSQEIEKVSGGKSKGNIRKMHGKEVVGKAVEIICDDVNKVIGGCVEVNEQTVQEAEKGYLNGFSIGGIYVKKWADPVHKGKIRFTPAIAEISVVDNPCVPDAVFNAIKDAEFAVLGADGVETMRKFAPKEDAKPTAADKAASAVAPLFALLDNLGLAKESDEEKDEEAEDAAEDGEMEDEGAKKPKFKLKSKKSADGAEVLEKGLSTVARIACLVEELTWVQKDMEWELAVEGDNSANPKAMKAAISTLIDVLKNVVTEETNEIRMENAAGLTARDVAALQKIAGAEVLKEWKAPATEAEQEADALKKVLAEMPAQIEKKFNDALEKATAPLKARIAELEKQPAPDNAVIRTVFKGGVSPDGADAEQHEVTKPVYLGNASPAAFKHHLNR